MPKDLRAALAIAAAFAACDPAPTARCILDGLTDARGLVSTGSDCSLSFDGSGVVDGLADLHAEGLRLFFADGCASGVRRAVRISLGDYYTLSQSDFSGELKTPLYTGQVSYEIRLDVPPGTSCRTTAYVTVYRGQAGRESDFRSQDL